MLDFETDIARHAEYTRDRRNKITRFQAASWFNPVRKLSLFGEAYPLAQWPADELAIIVALIAVIGIVGLVAF